VFPKFFSSRRKGKKKVGTLPLAREKESAHLGAPAKREKKKKDGRCESRIQEEKTLPKKKGEKKGEKLGEHQQSKGKERKNVRSLTILPKREKRGKGGQQSISVDLHRRGGRQLFLVLVIIPLNGGGKKEGGKGKKKRNLYTLG